MCVWEGGEGGALLEGDLKIWKMIKKLLIVNILVREWRGECGGEGRGCKEGRMCMV